MENKVTYLRYIWRTLCGLVYLGIVVAVLSVPTTKFDTLVIAGMVYIFATLLHNFSLIGTATDANNYAGFVRFRLLAKAQGVIANEDGTFEEQEKALADYIKDGATPVLIRRIANFAVQLYALFKIVQVAFFA
jgi:hypothetical protein